MTCLHHEHRRVLDLFAAAGCRTAAERNAWASAYLGRDVASYGRNAIRAVEVPALLAALTAAMNEPHEETP
jgi:hypothetical protein